MKTGTPNPDEHSPKPPLKKAFVDEDIDILARTLYGEARGEDFEGKVAVVWVIINRIRRAEERGSYWWGNTIKQVCLKGWQFSCWNQDDPNREKLMLVTDDNDTFAECLAIAEDVLEGELPDPAAGAMHYMTHARRKRGWPKDWGDPKEPCAEIGDHLFYNDVE